MDDARIARTVHQGGYADVLLRPTMWASAAARCCLQPRAPLRRSLVFSYPTVHTQSSVPNGVAEHVTVARALLANPRQDVAPVGRRACVYTRILSRTAKENAILPVLYQYRRWKNSVL